MESQFKMYILLWIAVKWVIEQLDWMLASVYEKCYKPGFFCLAWKMNAVQICWMRNMWHDGGNQLRWGWGSELRVLDTSDTSNTYSASCFDQI